MTGPATPFRGLVLGGASYAGLYRPIGEEEAQAALAAAWEGGIRAFDTAPHYGGGLSEERLGRFLAGKPRGEYVISTKVGRLLYDDPDAVDGAEEFYGAPKRSRRRDYSAAGVRRSMEESLGRLGIGRVDLLLVHDPDDFMTAAITQALPELVRLREEGTIDHLGVGMNDADLALRLVRETPIDHVMIAGRYTLLDRRGTELLDECAARGVAVLIAGVFNSGMLADPVKQATFNYVTAPRQLIDRALAMQEACLAAGVELRAAALQFPLRHPAVTAVVSGAGTVSSIADTFAQNAAPIPEDLWPQLERFAMSAEDWAGVDG